MLKSASSEAGALCAVTHPLQDPRWPHWLRAPFLPKVVGAGAGKGRGRVMESCGGLASLSLPNCPAHAAPHLSTLWLPSNLL